MPIYGICPRLPLDYCPSCGFDPREGEGWRVRKVFISSCSRRQLARRRLNRGGVLRMQLLLVLLVLALGVGAFVAGRVGI